MNRKAIQPRFSLLVAVVLLGGLLIGCVGNLSDRFSATTSQIITDPVDPEQDILLGTALSGYFIQQYGGLYTDPALNAYVSEVGTNIAAYAEFQTYNYRFILLDTPIIDSFSLPDGTIGLTRGLLVLLADEAELASVIAHEIGHINARNSYEWAQMYFAALSNGGRTNVTYSEDQAIVADLLAMRYVSKAGYAPEAAGTFVDYLEKNHPRAFYLRTPPRTSEQVDLALQESGLAGTSGGFFNRSVFLRALDRISYGPSEQDPLRRNLRPSVQSDIIPLDEDIDFRLPPGFAIDEVGPAISALDRTGARMTLGIVEALPQSAAQFLLTEWLGEQEVLAPQTRIFRGVDLAQGQLRIKEREGLVAVLRLPGAQLERDRFVQVALFYQPESDKIIERDYAQVFNQLLAGIRKKADPVQPAGLGGYAASFFGTRPGELFIRRVQSGDTPGKLAAPFNRRDPEEAMRRFLILNRLDPGAPLPEDYVKTLR